MKNIQEMAKLKFKLFFYGIKSTNEELIQLKTLGYRVPAFVRTGASYGIEAIVEKLVHVNIPLNPNSPIRFSKDFKSLLIGNKILCKIDILKSATVSLTNEREKETNEAARICFDRLGITLYGGCHFKEIKKGCKFCGVDISRHFRAKKILTPMQVVELVDDALSIPNHGIRHILLSGGVLAEYEFGAKRIAETAVKLKTRYPDLPIYVMMPPPSKNETLQYLIDSGIDEIAFNIEIMNNDIRKRIAPAKDEIGISRYFSALEYLSLNLPKFSARSILMGGIEPFNSTLKGVEELCKRGVMPIISYYRVIGNTVPSLFRTEEDVYNLWESAVEVAEKYDMVIGPTCIPCQNNVISLPTNNYFKFY